MDELQLRSGSRWVVALSRSGAKQVGPRSSTVVGRDRPPFVDYRAIPAGGALAAPR